MKFKGSRTRTQSRVFYKNLPFLWNHDDSQTITTCRLIINGMIFTEYSTSKSMKFCQLVKLMIFFSLFNVHTRPTLLSEAVTPNTLDESILIVKLINPRFRHHRNSCTISHFGLHRNEAIGILFGSYAGSVCACWPCSWCRVASQSQKPKQKWDFPGKRT